MPRSFKMLYNYWIHLFVSNFKLPKFPVQADSECARALELTIVIFYFATFAFLASEIPFWDVVDDRSRVKNRDKTFISAVCASKAAVALSFTQFLTL